MCLHHHQGGVGCLNPVIHLDFQEYSSANSLELQAFGDFYVMLRIPDIVQHGVCIQVYSTWIVRMHARTRARTHARTHSGTFQFVQ